MYIYIWFPKKINFAQQDTSLEASSSHFKKELPHSRLADWNPGLQSDADVEIIATSLIAHGSIVSIASFQLLSECMGPRRKTPRHMWPCAVADMEGELGISLTELLQGKMHKHNEKRVCASKEWVFHSDNSYHVLWISFH